MERTFFFLGSALQVFGQCGGASIRTRFCENYFSGDLNFRKTETNFVFEFCPRGGGVWGGIRAGFLIFFWRAGTEKKLL